MATMKYTPQTLTAARAILDGKNSVVIGHNTKLESAVNGDVYATYHGNRIVHYAEDGVRATYAGWATSTTTNRLNQLAPARFNIKAREPYINGEEVNSWSEWVKVS